MSLLKKIKNLFISFEDMVSKEHSCIVCAKEIPDGTNFQMCENCCLNIEKIEGKICSKCGDKLDDGKLRCDKCNDFDYNFKSNRSYCYYDEASAKIIKSLKYGGRKYYAKHIAKMMTQDLSVFKDVDLITFVPISVKRKRIRGFNQAEEIAKEISKIVNIPVKKILLKTKENKNQARLNQKERLENLKGTFEIDNAAESFEGKVVLIIDDVFTTGATLSECSKTLINGNPKSVLTFTFAKTKLNSIN